MWCHSMQLAPVYQSSLPKRWGRKGDHLSGSNFLWTLICCCTGLLYIHVWILGGIWPICLNLIWENRVTLAASQWGVCVSLLLQLKLKLSLFASEWSIDSLGTHLCPIMEQSLCAVTSIWRSAPPYLLILRLRKNDKQLQHFLVWWMSATLTVLLLKLDVIKRYQWQRTFFAVLWYS